MGGTGFSDSEDGAGATDGGGEVSLGSAVYAT